MTEAEQAAYDKGCMDTAKKLQYIYQELSPALQQVQSYLEEVLDEDMRNSIPVPGKSYIGMSMRLYNLGRNLQSRITQLNLET
jgi:hypothetical protein